jgi:sulfiredoxin
MVMEAQDFKIEDIYVPVKLKKAFEAASVEKFTDLLMNDETLAPVLVRKDPKKGLVLVKGVHRLEACRDVGDVTIKGFLVHARLT